MTLRTRASKGSALTHNELDANFKKVVTQKTSAYTVTVADNRATIEGNHASTPFTVTLPTVANAGAAETGDFEVTITNINAAVVTVDGNGAETIDGAANLALQQWDSVTCQLDSAGTAWKTVDRVHADLSFDASGDATFANALTVSGAFTSIGIDDNATGERVELSDGAVRLGTSGGDFEIRHQESDRQLQIRGGDGDGGSLGLYGASHASKAGDIELSSSGNLCAIFDESSGTWVLNTGSGSKTTALTINSSQAATFAGDVTVSGDFTSVGIDDNATGERLQLSDSAMQLGTSGSLFSLHHAANTNSVAISGGNAASDGGSLLMYGSANATQAGDFSLRSNNQTVVEWDEDAGSFVISTDSGAKTTALTIDASQNSVFAGSVTASGFVGDVTGNADTVTTNANLTGDVTSVGNATTLTVDAITGQTATTSVTGTDEILINDGGALRRMDVIRLITGATDIGADITDTDELMISDGGDLRRTDVSRLRTWLYGAQVTNHIRAGNVQIWDGENNWGTALVVSTDVTEGSWESVGPTGSGATNIWTPMDNLPSNATILIVNVDLRINKTSGGRADLQVNAVEGDVTTPTEGSRNLIASASKGTSGGDSASQWDGVNQQVYIPLGPTNQDFKIYWSGNGQDEAVIMSYRGFITD